MMDLKWDFDVEEPNRVRLYPMNWEIVLGGCKSAGDPDIWPMDMAILKAMTDAPVLLKEAYEALRDILNAAENQQPYSAEELRGQFNEITNKLYEAVCALENPDEQDTVQAP